MLSGAKRVQFYYGKNVHILIIKIEQIYKLVFGNKSELRIKKNKHRKGQRYLAGRRSFLCSLSNKIVVGWTSTSLLAQT
jgi:hypothetical protein